jgi:hypothetical protein
MKNKFIALLLIILGVLFLTLGAAVPVIDDYAVTIEPGWPANFSLTLPPLSLSIMSLCLGALCLCAGWLRFNAPTKKQEVKQ